MGLTSPGHNVLLSVLMGNVLIIRLKDIAPRADPKGVLIGADPKGVPPFIGWTDGCGLTSGSAQHRQHVLLVFAYVS